MSKLCYILCLVVGTSCFIDTADKKQDEKIFLDKKNKHREFQVPPIVPPGVTMLVDIPEDREDEDRISFYRETLESRHALTPSSAHITTPRSFDGKSVDLDLYDHKGYEGAAEPLAQIRLTNGKTVRCMLNALCTADTKDIDQRLQECLDCIPHITKHHSDTLPLFMAELKETHAYVARRLAARIQDMSQKRDQMVEKLALVLTSRSDFSEEEYKVFKADIHHRLAAYHESRRAQVRLPIKHCPGCCGGCNVL